VSRKVRSRAGNRGRRWAAAGVALIACALLSGCSTVSQVIADSWPHALGGLPPGVPPRDAEPPPPLAVHDLPPARDTTRLTVEERKKQEEELRATRTQSSTQAEEARRAAPGR
jgi:hypothetical protein